jgi:riboflavin kinase/FMN adenylyltransferase
MTRMKVTRGFAAYTPPPYPVLTIGNFDGQHRGHQALLEAVVEAARTTGGTSIVLTFDPHPVRILAPQVELRFLTSMEEKLARFAEAGIAEVVFLEFTPAFAALTPEEFVRQVLCEAIGVRELFVGEHFAFGNGRAGRIADLQRLAVRFGFLVHPMPPVRIDGEIVSSTRIRQLIQAGEMARAARLLGRPYALGGVVVRGEQRGRSMGWPTANLRLPPGRVVPPDGVYATNTIWKGRTLPSVAYIGTRPTFGPGERLLEVYVLDQALDLYGDDVSVQFVERLRGDQAFASAEELSARIGLDISLARASLSKASQATVDS